MYIFKISTNINLCVLQCLNKSQIKHLKLLARNHGTLISTSDNRSSTQVEMKKKKQYGIDKYLVHLLTEQASQLLSHLIASGNQHKNYTTV